MPQDAFHVAREAKELSALLLGGKVNRITQSNKDELTLIIYTGKRTVKLVLSTNATFARVCLSETEKTPLSVAPNFCMLLRKHLLGAEILSIGAPKFERIVEIRFRAESDFSFRERTLVCEIMGKYSNLILLDEKGVILGALKQTTLEENCKRILFSGAPYLPPARQEKFLPCEEEKIEKAEEEFFSLRERTTEAEAEFLFTFVAGFALSTAKEAVQKFSGTVAKNVLDFYENEPVSPCVVLGETGAPTDFFSFPVQNGKSTPSLLSAVDKTFSFREEKRAFSEEKTRLESVVRAWKKKTLRALADVNERLENAKNGEENRLNGELLTANLYRVPTGEKSVSLLDYYSGKERSIALDPFLTPSQNAQRYFKTYQKQKRTIENLLPRKKAEEDELTYIESVEFSLASASAKEDLSGVKDELTELKLLRENAPKTNKKKPPEISFRTFEKDGFTVLCGRNNLQNDALLRLLSPNDLWLHAKDYHSAHVGIITNGRAVPNEVLLYSAQICARYSSGAGGGKIAVDYTMRKFVKKPPKAKPGFVLYSENKTLLVDPQDETE